jgi:hypothetical protein
VTVGSPPGRGRTSMMRPLPGVETSRSPLGATARKRAPGTRACTCAAKPGGTVSERATSNGAVRIAAGTSTVTRTEAPAGAVAAEMAARTDGSPTAPGASGGRGPS